MAKLDKAFEQEFRDALFESFGFLRNDFGFSISEDYAMVYTAHNENCQITISLDLPPSIIVEIKPFQEIDLLKKYYPIPSAGLEQIVRVYDAAFKEYPREIKKDELRSEMARLAVLVKQYCSSMLRGDFTDWPKIEAARGR